MVRPVERQLFCLPLWGDLHLYSFFIKVVIVSSDLWKWQRTLGGFLFLTGSPVHRGKDVHTEIENVEIAMRIHSVCKFLFWFYTEDQPTAPILSPPSKIAGKQGWKEGGEGRKREEGELKSSRNKERHPFAHQFFFLLSEPRKRERPPLSLCDRNACPSWFSSPPPMRKQHEWRATFRIDEWEGVEIGRGSFWPPQPSFGTTTCAAY